MYGTYEFTFQYTGDNINLGISQEGDLFRYHREIIGRPGVEKLFMADEGQIVINPTEPLNLPKEVTNFLEIEFEPLYIAPAAKKEIFLTFPVEIAVILQAKREISVLDIFCLERPKYSLYGSESKGFVTRWAKSSVYPEFPATDPLTTGVISLLIENTTREWISIARVVFEGIAMKIWYGERVAMQARMRLLSQRLAETEFIDKPLDVGMNKSIELYTARELHVVKRSFLMEEGLV